MPLHGVNDGGFGWPAAIVKGGEARPFVGKRARAGLAGHGDRLGIPAALRVDRAEDARRRDDHVGPACRFGHVMPSDQERSPIAKAAQDLPGCHVEADIEELCHTQARPYAEIAGRVQKDIGDVSMGDLDAIRLTGRARGEQDEAPIVREGRCGLIKESTLVFYVFEQMLDVDDEGPLR